MAEPTQQETYDAGLAMRRTVLGADHVQRSLESASEFTQPIQELVTRYCWGEVWTRDELSPKIRSLLNLVMLTALNRPHEFQVHVRGAISNGVTIAEIQGALLQTAIYVGVPAALEAFRLAEAVLSEFPDAD